MTRNQRPTHLPPWLFRPTPPNRDLGVVRLEVLGALRRAYGLEEQHGEGLYYQMCIGLCRDFIAAYNGMMAPPGTERIVTEPLRLFIVVKAVESVVRDDPNPLYDPKLRSLAEAVAQDITTNKKRSGVASICKLLNERKGAWHKDRVKAETLRDNFKAMQKRYGALYEDARYRVLLENISRYTEVADDNERDLG